MKLKLMAFALAASLAAFGQGRGGMHGGGAPMGGPPAGMGSGAGTMGTPHDHPGNMGNMGTNGTTSHPGANLGRETPDKALSSSPQLSSRLDNLLPKGETAQQACSGFKNLGQCVAAIHVSHNLGISFDDLKAKMTGTSPESLGKAIQTLKPAVNSKAEVKKAQKQANQDLSQASS